MRGNVADVIYDVHAHCIPVAFRRWIERTNPAGVDLIETERGLCVGLPNAVRTAPLRADLGDLDLRIESMDRAGVDVQLLAGWIDLTAYELAPASGLEWAKAHNDCIAEEAAKHPERLLPMANIPLQDPAAAAKELERAMTDLDMVGVQVATTVRDHWIDEAHLDPVWEAASSLGAIVVLHPMRPLTGISLPRYFMENAVARPAETAIALSGLILAGTFERHPDLRFVSVHGGGNLPFQIGRLDRAFRQKPGLAGRDIERLPSESLKQINVDTVVHNPAAIRYLVDLMGADHVVLGTDYPFEMGDDDPVGFIRSIDGLTDDERESILGGNVSRLLDTAS